MEGLAGIIPGQVMEVVQGCVEEKPSEMRREGEREKDKGKSECVGEWWRTSGGKGECVEDWWRVSAWKTSGG